MNIRKIYQYLRMAHQINPRLGPIKHISAQEAIDIMKTKAQLIYETFIPPKGEKPKWEKVLETFDKWKQSPPADKTKKPSISLVFFRSIYMSTPEQCQSFLQNHPNPTLEDFKAFSKTISPPTIPTPMEEDVKSLKRKNEEPNTPSKKSRLQRIPYPETTTQASAITEKERLKETEEAVKTFETSTSEPLTREEDLMSIDTSEPEKKNQLKS